MIHRQGTIFRGGLKYPSIAADCLAQKPAFRHGQGGFLADDVLARPQGYQRHGHVPVIGRGNADRIDIAAVDDVAEIRVTGTILVLILTINAIAGLLPVSLVHVADGHHLSIRLFQEGAQILVAFAAYADASNGNPIGGTTPFASTDGGRRHHGRGQSRCARRVVFRNFRRDQGLVILFPFLIGDPVSFCSFYSTCRGLAVSSCRNTLDLFGRGCHTDSRQLFKKVKKNHHEKHEKHEKRKERTKDHKKTMSAMCQVYVFYLVFFRVFRVFRGG